jgi:hypothetical protein
MIKDWDDIDAELLELCVLSDVAYEAAREQAYDQPMPRAQVDRLITVASILDRKLSAFKEAIAGCEIRRQ